MPPFRYDPVRSPYVGSIGDMIAREGEIRARAALESGQAWAGAAQNIGNTVASTIQQQTDPKAQMARIALSNAQHEQAGQAAMADLMTPKVPQGPAEGGGNLPAANPFLKQEGDVSVWDTEGLSKAMAAKGYGDLTPKVVADIGSLNKAHRDEAQARQQFGQAQTNVMAKGAGTALAILRDHPNADPNMVVGFIGDQMVANGTFPPEKIAAVKAQLLSDPTQLLPRLEALSKAGTQAPVPLKKDEQLLNPNDLQGAPLASNIVPEKKPDYTVNGQRFNGMTNEPYGPAVPKQVEPPKVGSEEDFVTTYAKEKFNKPATALTVAEKSEALGAFKAANADQEVRAAALAQKNIAEALAKIKEGQQPTAEDAKTVAEDLVNHRQSPSQVKLMFGTRGIEGQAFMLKVNTAAKALDPNFNYEEAESGYQLAKSPGFQNTVRYMDSTLESMPQLLKNAKALDNGNVRSINALVNAGKDQFNNVDLKKFKTDATLVGDEVAKILSGGGTGSATSDAKLKQGMELLSTTDSPKAIAATLEEIQTLMGNRRRALTRGTYMEGASAAKPSGGLTVTDPNGGVHTFTSQADADKFKAAAGIK